MNSTLKLWQMYSFRQYLEKTTIFLLIDSDDVAAKKLLQDLGRLNVIKKQQSGGNKLIISSQEKELSEEQIQQLQKCGQYFESIDSLFIKISNKSIQQSSEDVDFIRQRFLLFTILRYTTKLRFIFVVPYSICLDAILLKNFLEYWRCILKQKEENQDENEDRSENEQEGQTKKENIDEISQGITFLLTEIQHQQDKQQFLAFLHSIQEEEKEQQISFTNFIQQNPIQVLYLDQKREDKEKFRFIRNWYNKQYDVSPTKMDFTHGFTQSISQQKKKSVMQIIEKQVTDEKFLQYIKTTAEIFCLSCILYLIKIKQDQSEAAKSIQNQINQKIKPYYLNQNLFNEVPEGREEQVVKILDDISMLFEDNITEDLLIFQKLKLNKTILELNKEHYFRKSLQYLKDIKTILIYFGFYIDLNGRTIIFQSIKQGFTNALQKIGLASEANPDLSKDEKFNSLQQKYSMDNSFESDHDNQYKFQKLSPELQRLKYLSFSTENKNIILKDWRQTKSLLEATKTMKQDQKLNILTNLHQMMYKYHQFTIYILLLFEQRNLQLLRDFLNNYFSMIDNIEQAKIIFLQVKKFLGYMQTNKQINSENQAIADQILKICFNFCYSQMSNSQNDFQIYQQEELKNKQILFSESASMISIYTSATNNPQAKRIKLTFFRMRIQEEKNLVERIRKKQQSNYSQYNQFFQGYTNKKINLEDR